MRVKIQLLVVGAMLTTGATVAPASELPDICRSALKSVEVVTNDPTATATIENALSAQIAKLEKPSWSPGYCKAIASNLASKVASHSEGASFTAETIISSTVEFEAFRITNFRNSGVAPKRYFGFLDEKGRTAAYETKLRTVSARVSPIINAYAEEKRLGVRVTPKEIIVTHLAEGGALLLTRDFYLADSIHPVSGIGLDDYRLGLKQYADLVSTIDIEFKSRLAAIANNPERPRANAILGAGTVRRLERYVGAVSMTFDESVLATAIMYLWEKVITEQKRRAAGGTPLNTLSLDEQFVVTSLVYNSGILFSDERVRQIMAFDTAEYLAETSEKNAATRQKLPVMQPNAADALLERDEPLPVQPTSWNAVYHILQRYGAWVALTKFASFFSPDGEILPTHPPQ